MQAEEYASLVAEIARLHVCENKPVHKMVARAVMKHSPMAVLANSLREPTEDELLEVVEKHNPFAVDDLTDELRSRYTAFCKLHIDVEAAISQYRQDRFAPVSYRVLEGNRYLTWLEADPNCVTADDDKMAEYDSRNEAAAAAEVYGSVMSSIGGTTTVEVAAFNRYHERIQ